MRVEPRAVSGRTRIKSRDANKRPWTLKQEHCLRERINEMMAEYGCIDMAAIAYHCNHSMTSCSWKAYNLGISFRVRTVKKSFENIKPIKGNMKQLPFHFDGTPVKYEDVEHPKW